MQPSLHMYAHVHMTLTCIMNTGIMVVYSISIYTIYQSNWTVLASSSEMHSLLMYAAIYSRTKLVFVIIFLICRSFLLVLGLIAATLGCVVKVEWPTASSLR